MVVVRLAVTILVIMMARSRAWATACIRTITQSSTITVGMSSSMKSAPSWFPEAHVVFPHTTRTYIPRSGDASNSVTTSVTTATVAIPIPVHPCCSWSWSLPIISPCPCSCFPPSAPNYTTPTAPVPPSQYSSLISLLTQVPVPCDPSPQCKPSCAAMGGGDPYDLVVKHRCCNDQGGMRAAAGIGGSQAGIFVTARYQQQRQQVQMQQSNAFAIGGAGTGNFQFQQ